MKKSSFVESFNCAIEGFIYVVKTQRNMRIHFLFSVMIILLSILLNLSTYELLIVGSAIIFVLLSEMINTAIELTVDLISDSYHALARIVKDVAAGAVFLSSIYAIIVGYLIFSKHISFPIGEGLLKIKQSDWHITLITLILVISFVILGKILFQKGTPLRGGMPSGHAAFSFSIWTIISVITENPLIIILTFVMAFLVARSRVKQSIHSILEVVIGSILGILITLLVFQFIGR